VEVIEMKTTVLLAVSLILTLIVIGFSGCDSITGPPSGTAKLGSTVGQQSTGIWVNGQGKVTITPDIALLVVGVEAQEDTVMEAQSKASAAMNDLMRALKNNGIAEEDIQTRYFRISQRTRWDNINDEEIVTGYQVNNTATVKIRDIDRAGNIVDAAVQAGGDYIRIDSFSFTVEDPTKYYDEAREKATADAKEKAEKLAKQNDVKLGEPTFISESIYTPASYGGITYGLDSMAIPAPTISIPTSVSPGEIDVTLAVQIAYNIE
jgi:uncharacterized protein YggE